MAVVASTDHGIDAIVSVPRQELIAVHWIFRGAVAAEFVGHGAFGIITEVRPVASARPDGNRW
jgi:hypothetical protein